MINKKLEFRGESRVSLLKFCFSEILHNSTTRLGYLRLETNLTMKVTSIRFLTGRFKKILQGYYR